MQTDKALANGGVSHETLMFDGFENEILQKVFFHMSMYTGIFGQKLL